MGTLRFNDVFFACILLLAAIGAQAQNPMVEKNFEASHLELAATYQAMLSNPVGSGSKFWLQGGSVQLHGRFWHGLGAVAEISGLHTGNAAPGIGLDMVTATFGPRYTWPATRKGPSFYSQALIGEAIGFNSTFPAPNASSSSADRFALVVGGGVNYPLQHHLSLRAFEAEWVRTQMPNAASNVQNNLRIGAGLILHIK